MTHSREDCWPRLEQVIRWSNLTINHFARHIGLLRGENLYQIKRGNNGISRKLAEMIATTYPEIDPLWLLSGHGNMLKEEGCDSSQIDFYDADAEGDIGLIESLIPSSKLMLPGYISADIAMIYRGEAMSPSITPNSTVILKSVTSDMIIPGAEYLVSTSNISSLRIIRHLNPEAPGEMLRLSAVNSSRYDDIFIEIRQIKQLYKVVAKLVINN